MKNGLAKIAQWYYTILVEIDGSSPGELLKRGVGRLKQKNNQVDNNVKKKTDRMGHLLNKLSVCVPFACAVIACVLLMSPSLQAAEEINREAVAPVQPAQPTVSQPSALMELRDEKKGDVTVSVQSLDDVVKVMTSSVPERLEANVQPVTARNTVFARTRAW